MQLAATMLAEGKAPIAQVAGDVGYESEAAFSRAFKRAVGTSPSLWRESRASTPPAVAS
jgi:AraC-like DNA-binding protein